MIISYRELDDTELNEMSLEDLEQHAGAIARAENDLRGYAIKVNMMIINKIHEIHGINGYKFVGKLANRPPMKVVKTVKLDAIEDEFSIEDFK